MKISRTWTVMVTPEDAGETWPDHQYTYGKQILRPDSLTVGFSQSKPGNALRATGSTVSGYRVLKSGELSEHRVTDGYLPSRAGVNLWVDRAVTLALMAIDAV